MRIALLFVIITLAGADWPRFLGPLGNNTSAEKGILTTWPRTGLKKLWDCEMGTGYAPPVIANGKLYHVDAFKAVCRLTCRDAANGKELWRYEYPFVYEDTYGYDDGPRCGPTLDGDRIYIYGVEGTLTCVGIDGSKRWSVDTKTRYPFHQNFFGVGSAPIIHDTLIIVAVGGSAKGPRPSDLRDAKPNGTGLVAFDKLSGEVKWAAIDELASYASPELVTLHGKRVGLYFARGGLVIFEPATGRQLARYPFRAKSLESVNAANPLVVGDTILLSECYGPGSVCLTVQPDWTLVERWSDKEKDREDRSLACHWNTPIEDAGFVFGSSGRHTPEGDLRCIHFATGELKWREKRTTRCSLLKVDGHFLSLGEYGELRLFQATSAKYDERARWESPDLEYPCWAPPALSNGRLYVRGKTRLVCYEFIR
jgi:outer membrane protein assembly factor BamB